MKRLLLLLLGLAPIAPAQSPHDFLQRGTIAGGERQWLVHLPPPVHGNAKLPLVVAFHGHYGTPTGMERLTGLDRIADRDGFIVVYPAGIDRSWAAGVNAPADRQHVNDLAFVTALLQRLETEYSIDPHRIVLTGFSNGAHFVNLLGCRLAGKISAIVPVSGTLAASQEANCHPARPLTVIEFHGTSDPIDPYAGGSIQVSGGGAVLPVKRNLADWARWDGCAPRAVSRPVAQGPNGLQVDLRSYPHCRDGVHVEFYRLAGAGHTWPGGPQYLPPRWIGLTTDLVQASRIIGAVATGPTLRSGAAASPVPHADHQQPQEAPDRRSYERSGPNKPLNRDRSLGQRRS